MVVFYQCIFEVEAKKPNPSSHQISSPPLSLIPNIGLHREPMEGQPSSALVVMASERAEVDTTRPFRSVREAVAVFGERFLASDAYSQKTNAITPKPIYSVSTPKPIYSVSTPKPLYSASSSPPSYTSSSSHFNQDREDELVILNSLRKLEAELEETKRELMLLKERESELEIAVASLSADLHKNMSKLAQIEAAGLAEVAKSSLTIEEQSTMVKSELWREERNGFEYLPSLAEALSLGEREGNFEIKKKAKMKKKPIIPLIGGMFFKKKVSSDFDNAIYTRSFYGALS